MTKSDRWILSEYLVARNRVDQYGDCLLSHRHITPYAEVDLVFKSPQTGQPLLIIEVKSISIGMWSCEIISRRQKHRLERARWYMEEKSKRSTLLTLATVETNRVGVPIIRYFNAPF